MTRPPRDNGGREAHFTVARWGHDNSITAENPRNHAGETGTTYGLAIVIEHPDGTSTMYAHLARVDTQPGAVVSGGTPIGLVGKSGSDAYQPHLHFEVKSGWAVSDRRNQLPTYSYMRQRGVDLGPCFGGPCELAGG